MLSTIHRLQLATRIQLALLRQGADSIDMLRMLRERGYAQGVLELCHDACDYSLSGLANEFSDTLAAEDARRELAQAAVAARTALSRIALGAPPVILQRRPAQRQPAIG